MCCFANKAKNKKVYKVHYQDEELEQTDIVENLPEHVDNPYLNRSIPHGVLGFRYENKNATIIVYSSVETKTFYYIMQLKPLRCLYIYLLHLSKCVITFCTVQVKILSKPYCQLNS